MNDIVIDAIERLEKSHALREDQNMTAKADIVANDVYGDGMKDLSPALRQRVLTGLRKYYHRTKIEVKKPTKKEIRAKEIADREDVIKETFAKHSIDYTWKTPEIAEHLHKFSEIGKDVSEAKSIVTKWLKDRRVSVTPDGTIDDAPEAFYRKIDVPYAVSIDDVARLGSDDPDSSDLMGRSISPEVRFLIDGLKKRNQKLESQVDQLRERAAADYLYYDALNQSIRNNKTSRLLKTRWYEPPKASHDKKHDAIAVAHVSDWHIGGVDHEPGINDFNLAIAEERVKLYTDKVIRWAECHRSAYNINEIAVLVTGDLINGEIHEENIRTNEFNIPDQIFHAANLLSKMLEAFSSAFSKVTVHFIVPDNHSRITKKVEMGDYDNYHNNSVGIQARTMVSSIPNIQFNLYNKANEVVVSVGERNYLIMHGNSVRGGALGIPYYSIQRKVGAEAKIRINLPQEYQADKIVMGHYHTPMMDNYVEMTGSLCGTTAYDFQSGRHCNACQSAWLVIGRHESDYNVIWLSGELACRG
jgi:hypothetical protein